MKLETKRVQTVDLKLDGPPGSLIPLFSTFNVIDLDGDVVLPGAFDEGKVVPIGRWNHENDEPSIGAGTITTDGVAARLTPARLFVDEGMHAANEMYASLKGRQSSGIPSEWSYVYYPTEFSFGEQEGRQVRFLKRIDVVTVDPVGRGASIGTTTEGIKRAPTGQGTYTEHAGVIVADARAFVERAKARIDFRQGNDRKPSKADMESLEDLRELISSIDGDLESLLAAGVTDPKQADPPNEDWAPKIRTALAFASTRMRELQEITS